jgi:hypothetical protein
MPNCNEQAMGLYESPSASNAALAIFIPGHKFHHFKTQPEKYRPARMAAERAVADFRTHPL